MEDQIKYEIYYEQYSEILIEPKLMPNYKYFTYSNSIIIKHIKVFVYILYNLSCYHYLDLCLKNGKKIWFVL